MLCVCAYTNEIKRIFNQICWIKENIIWIFLTFFVTNKSNHNLMLSKINDFPKYLSRFSFLEFFFTFSRLLFDNKGKKSYCTLLSFHRFYFQKLFIFVFNFFFLRGTNRTQQLKERRIKSKVTD